MKKLVIIMLLAAFVCTATAQKNAQGVAKRAVQFTVLQWNIWQEGTLIPGGFEAIVGELQNLQPDFVTLSEVRNYNDVDFTHRLCQALKEKGLTYYSFRSKDSGLLSKHPIIDWRPIFPENRDHGISWWQRSKALRWPCTQGTLTIWIAPITTFVAMTAIRLKKQLSPKASTRCCA